MLVSISGFAVCGNKQPTYTEVPATDMTSHELSSVAGAGSSCLELIPLEQLSLSYIFFLNKLNGYQIS